MKRIFAIISALTLSLGVFTSCGDYDYYEPAFYDDTIDYTISALGGDYPIQYKFEYYTTKNIKREFDFDYRLIIDGRATEALQPKDVTHDYDKNGEKIYSFYVTIPANTTGHLRPIVVEASTHFNFFEEEDYWSEWFPIISTVQMY